LGDFPSLLTLNGGEDNMQKSTLKRTLVVVMVAAVVGFVVYYCFPGF
jgi:hypothetical protein